MVFVARSGMEGISHTVRGVQDFIATVQHNSSNVLFRSEKNVITVLTYPMLLRLISSAAQGRKDF